MDAIAALCEVIASLCEVLAALCEVIPAALELLCQTIEMLFNTVDAMLDWCGFSSGAKACLFSMVLVLVTACAGDAVIARNGSGTKPPVVSTAVKPVAVPAQTSASRTVAGEPARIGARQLTSVFHKVKKWGAAHGLSRSGGTAGSY